MVINDRVYDVTDFLGFHPAGIEIMLEHAGTDASTAFLEKGHSLDAVAMLDKYLIGELVKVTTHFFRTCEVYNSYYMEQPLYLIV